MGLIFTWDRPKAAANQQKHEVEFEEVATVFGDPLSLTIPDAEHSVGEVRHLILGESHVGRLLVVSHVEKADNIRIISARLATRRERQNYEQR